MSDPDRVLFFLLKPVVRACKEFGLLSDGDWIAVAVSGGKDSRVLLQLLLRCQRKMPCRYELLALHAVGTSAGFPDSPACPQGLLSRRAHIRVLLGQFGRDQKQIRANIRRADRRVMGF